MVHNFERSGVPIISCEIGIQKIHLMRWHILYTYPRAEKLVYEELIKRKFEVFLPMTKKISEWKNRQKKLIEFALFPGYIFVYSKISDLWSFARIPKVVSFLQFEGKPAQISTKEIECIKKMICLDNEPLITTQYFEGENVRIIRGPLAGFEGTLIKKNGRTRFCIRLNQINYSVVIYVGKNDLVKL